MPKVTIQTSGSDPARKLGVVLSEVTTNETHDSLEAIEARLAGYILERQAIDQKEAADQALRDAIVGVFTAAGVTDLDAPTDDIVNTAIQTQNDAANKAVVEEQVGVLQAQIADVAVAEPVVPVTP